MTREPDRQLEDVARRRITRLLDAVDVGPPPAVPQDHDLPVLDLGVLARDPRPRRRVVVAIAAAVAVLLGVGVAVTLQRGRDDPGPADDGAGNPVPRLVPDHMPAGLEPSGTAELPLPADDLDPGRIDVTVFGAGPGRLGRFWPAVGVVVVEDETVGMDGRDVPIGEGQGRAGSSTAHNDVGLAEGTGVVWCSWDVTAELEVTLVDWFGSQFLFEDVCGRASVDESGDVDLDDLGAALPDDYEPLGTLRDAAFGGGSPYASRDAEGHVASYGSTDGGFLEVTTVAHDPGGVDVARWMANALEAVEVRGHEGWIAETPSPDGSTVTVLWPEAPGVLGVVRAVDVDRDEVLAVANGLRPAT
jgi:hypothetical protein